MRRIVDFNMWKSRAVLSTSGVMVVGGPLYLGSDSFRAPWMDFFAAEVGLLRIANEYYEFMHWERRRMNNRRYLSFGVEFFSGGCRDTTAFVWTMTLRGDMLKKDLTRLAGGFTARENLDHFGGDETPFLRLMAGLVADAADPPMTPRRRQVRLFAQPERPRGRAR